MHVDSVMAKLGGPHVYTHVHMHQFARLMRRRAAQCGFAGLGPYSKFGALCCFPRN
jgi:hypothetical protein